MTVELRRAEPDDVDFLLALITGDDTQQFLGMPGRAREDVAADVERSLREPGVFGWFVVEADGERAGCVSFRTVNERNRIAEAGRFAIDPRCRGRGVGLAAACAFQRLLLLELDFHRIELQIYGFNERAIRHAERCGYVREGVKRKAYMKFGEWQDAVLFSLLQDDLNG